MSNPAKDPAWDVEAKVDDTADGAAFDPLTAIPVNAITDFPGYASNSEDPVTLSHAEAWAESARREWGGDAEFRVLALVLDASIKGEQFQFRGWRNVYDVLTGISRGASLNSTSQSSETIH